jgi:osmotically-inducible protein OsmY
MAMKPDRMLKDKIEQAIRNNASIDARFITVEVQKGIVTLSGIVPDAWQKQLTADTAQRVEDCHALVVNLCLPSASATLESDQDLASRIVAALSCVEGLSPHSVCVEVERGSVTLTGNVDHDVQRAAIEMRVGGICGVAELNNLISLGGRLPLAS